MEKAITLRKASERLRTGARFKSTDAGNVIGSLLMMRAFTG